MSRWIQWLCASAAAVFAFAAHAQPGPGGYPDRPVRLVIPTATGSLTDPVARILADEMRRRTGQPWTVETRPGAGGTIGTEAVVRAAPDGYTLLLTANNLVISPSLYRNVHYNVSTDLAPIGFVASGENVLVAPPHSNLKTLADAMAAARRHPTGLDFTSPLIGSSAHLNIEVLARQAGVRLNHIAYKDASQGTTDTLAGRIPLNMMGISTAVPHIQKGALVPLAVTGQTRLPELPSVPTFAEAGYPQVNVGLWFGLFAPAKLPAAQLAYLNQQLMAALRSPELVQRYNLLGVVPLPSSAAALAEAVARETPLFAKVAADIGLRLD
ncbi:MAG TPA: tripartite tricarboxylate transporter substrate-binding protein [Ramlibacter sp.]|nr:tripartite tricarboxylate transporter substrate-binding protein [Ramlibacter sp.]